MVDLIAPTVAPKMLKELFAKLDGPEFDSRRLHMTNKAVDILQSQLNAWLEVERRATSEIARVTNELEGLEEKLDESKDTIKQIKEALKLLK